LKEGDDVCVGASWVEGQGRDTDGRVDAADIEGILDRDGETMQRADGSAGAAEVVV
jgi:hypothetical protein